MKKKEKLDTWDYEGLEIQATPMEFKRWEYDEYPYYFNSEHIAKRGKKLLDNAEKIKNVKSFLKEKKVKIVLDDWSPYISQGDANCLGYDHQNLPQAKDNFVTICPINKEIRLNMRTSGLHGSLKNQFISDNHLLYNFFHEFGHCKHHEAVMDKIPNKFKPKTCTRYIFSDGEVKESLKTNDSTKIINREEYLKYFEKHQTRYYPHSVWGYWERGLNPKGSEIAAEHFAKRLPINKEK